MTDVGKTRTQDRLLLVADLAGTLVFAVGGAMLAASARLDLPEPDSPITPSV